MGYFAGIDLGGTAIKVGITDEEMHIIGRSQAATPRSKEPQVISDEIWQLVLLACREAGVRTQQLHSIGIGCPGSVDSKKGEILHACNLHLVGVPFSRHISEKSGKPVYLENDGNCALLGEWKYGAAQGYRNVVMLTLGTGIGGGILTEGILYRGFNSFGGEIGHMVIETDGISCSCGRKGCFEQYASATGLIRLTKEAMKRDRRSLMWDLCRGDLGKVDGTTAFNGQQQKDDTACKVVELFLKYLAVGVTNVINIFQPEALVIGGGVGRQGETLLAPLRSLVSGQVYSRYAGPQTNIVSSLLGNDAGMIGAALLGKEN